jgi:hypothetical protein
VVAGGSSCANAGADKRSAAAARVKKIFLDIVRSLFGLLLFVCLFVFCKVESEVFFDEDKSNEGV